MRARGVTAGLALALAGITPCSLAACGDGEPAAAPSPSRSVPTVTHTLTGSITTYLGGFVWNPGEGCWGYSDHADVTGGGPVVITNAGGDLVATGKLDRGSVQMNPDDPTRAQSCRYDFTVTGIPTGGKFYTVKLPGMVAAHPLQEAELSQRLDVDLP